VLLKSHSTTTTSVQPSYSSPCHIPQRRTAPQLCRNSTSAASLATTNHQVAAQSTPAQRATTAGPAFSTRAARAGTTRDDRRPCILLSGRPRLLGHHLPPVATAAAVTSFASAFGPLRSRSRSPDCWGCRWDWWASSPAWLGCRWARLGCTWARWANSPDWLGCSWASPANRRAMLASTWDWWAST